jgi:hypothetical protein
MAIVANLTADQGSSFAAIVDLKDPNGLPLNVTGQSFRAQFRKSYTSTNLTDFICQVIDAQNGKISIALTPDVTRNIKAGRYVYDIEMFDESPGNVTRVLEGQIEFTPAATTPNIGPTLYPYRLTGHGSPEGLVSAPPGYSYIDLDNGTLYFKMSGYSTTGWQAFVQL